MNTYTPADLTKLDNVPDELRRLPVWLYWKSIPKGPDEKPIKKPFYVDGRARGTTDTAEDRAKLVTLEFALPKFRDEYAGLGVALGPVPHADIRLSGIDLDKCLTESRELAPKVREVLAAAGDAYTEVSPSGTGIKLFGVGDIGTTKEAELEIYSGGRFFTVTGDRIQGAHLADLHEAAAVARRVLNQQRQGSGFAKGGRNNRMISEAGKLRERDVPEAEAWERIQKLNIELCAPPLSEHELRGIFKSAWRYAPGFAPTDLGNAKRLVARFGADLRFIHDFNHFLIWNGTHWAIDRDGEIERKTKDTVRGIYDEARDEKDVDRQKRLTAWALASQGAARIRAAHELTRSEPGIPIAPPALDADPMLLGVANGVLDLTSGVLREARREDYITKIAPVTFDAQAQAPQWEAFLHRIMGGDLQLVDYLQRTVGYSLTGRTEEQCLFLLLGRGGNGKTTFLNVIRAMLGDYSATTDVQTWMKRDRSSATNDLAALRGATLVASSEVEEGTRLAEVLIKLITGCDPITARFMYAEFFTFKPALKLWIAANHKPIIRGDDLAIWRRIRLIPFTVTIPSEERDRQLEAKLREELPGILRWAVEGALAWHREGLPLPDVVRAATNAYREEMDHFGQFLSERCEITPRRTARAGELFKAYRHWAEDQGINFPITLPQMWTKLAERGITRLPRTEHGTVYRGIGLRIAGLHSADQPQTDPLNELEDESHS